MGSEVQAFVRMSAREGVPATWRHFARPVRIIEAWHLAGVRACLREVEDAVQSGLYAVGFLSYEAAPAFESAFPRRHDEDFPLVWIGLFDSFSETEPTSDGVFGVGDWTPDTSQAPYQAAIARIREEIAAGNTYQVNYTLRLNAAFQGDDLALFRQLTAAQPTEYAAYLNTGRWRVLSVSPELFFRVHDGLIQTRPMKGTAPRGRTEAEDAAQAEQLRQSVKDRAENIMIVDLLRNDLGRVAQFGTVEVTDLCTVERYPTLLTMTSGIQARLQPGTTFTDILTALFPCGSVTGAPKINTTHIIQALEAQPRRVYCGAVGLLEPGGDMVFNVPIRTVLVDAQRGAAQYGAGGGITWDSTPEGEYAEVLNKAQVLRQAREPFSLLETLRLQDGVLTHLDEHLARMQSSARYFDYPWDESAVHSEIQRALKATPRGSHRFRLLLDRDGTFMSQTLPLDDVPEVTAWLARTPVQSSDVFLFHKTTCRDVYQAHTALVPAGQEVLLWNERGELTEFTTGSLIVRLDGQLYTPPVACGLLAGIARQQAIQSGEVAERLLTSADLSRAQDIWHVNSLRGWRTVTLVG